MGICMYVRGYFIVSLGIPYKFEGGPVGKKIPNLGPHGAPYGAHGATGAPSGAPNLEFSFPGPVVRDTVMFKSS